VLDLVITNDGNNLSRGCALALRSHPNAASVPPRRIRKQRCDLQECRVHGVQEKARRNLPMNTILQLSATAREGYGGISN
jgi:hypothetical protein